MLKDFLQDTILVNKLIYSEIKNGFKPEWYQEFEIGAGGDISSGIDLFAEKLFVKYLSKYGVIESEESGVIGSGDNTIIIDPIDGSSNALSGFVYFGSSVALIDKNGLLQVAVVANFANGDIFYKLLGEETKIANLEDTTSFIVEKNIKSPKIGLFEKAYSNYNIVKLLNEKGLKFRSPGATALSLAYARRVNFVLFIGKIRLYDIVAGVAMCEGLNVLVEDDYLLVSQNKEIFQTIKKILEENNEFK